MDAESFVQIYRFIMVIAFSVSVINWLGYTILAPWYRTALGWVIWTLLFSIVLVLFVPFMQITFRGLPFRYELSVGTLIFFIVALTLVGYGIYTTQIKGYLTYRHQLRVSKKLQEEEENSK